nr:ABC transporter substrate-binding protein [Paenibacillus phyllosphaerae]
MTFNLSKPSVLQDIRLRQAIHYAIDRTSLITDLGGIRQQPASGFFVRPYEAAYGSNRDEAKARMLVAQSIYQGEIIRLYTYTMPSNEQNAQWLLQACAKIGVLVEIVVVPIEQLYEPDTIQQADLIVVGEVLGEQPDITLIEMYTSRTGFIRNHLSIQDRAMVDGKISDCLKETDARARLNVLHRIQEELKNAYSLLFLYHSLQVADYDQSLHGISLNAWGKVNYKDVWVRRT